MVKNACILLLYDIYYYDYFTTNKTKFLALLILGGFYYTLGNIRPENRSHKNAIQLLGLVTSKHLKKYGVAPLLDAFIQDLAQLEQVSLHNNIITLWQLSYCYFYGFSSLNLNHHSILYVDNHVIINYLY